MCMMIEMARVSSTDIFATRHEGRDVLVYGAKLESLKQNAMILPLPLRQQGSHVELLDLSGYPRFFRDLFCEYFLIPSFCPPAFGPPIEVFTVGSFEASIVPSIDDFVRLDRRFQLSAGIRSVLIERYADWSFVVYQFGKGKHELHPFGVKFESRFSNHIFFPTVHVHDGAHAPAAATFAHNFYAQGARLAEYETPLDSLYPPLSPRQRRLPAFVDLTKQLAHGSRFGVFANVDVYAQLD
jgi:hypothetical protein